MAQPQRTTNAAISNTSCAVLFLSQEYVDKLSSDTSPSSLAPVWTSLDNNNNDCKKT